MRNIIFNSEYIGHVLTATEEAKSLKEAIIFKKIRYHKTICRCKLALNLIPVIPFRYSAVCLNQRKCQQIEKKSSNFFIKFQYIKIIVFKYAQNSEKKNAFLIEKIILSNLCKKNSSKKCITESSMWNKMLLCRKKSFMKQKIPFSHEYKYFSISVFT